MVTIKIEVIENGAGAGAAGVKWTDLREIQKYHSKTLILLLDQWGMPHMFLTCTGVLIMAESMLENGKNWKGPGFIEAG